jgi:hypothetical protein
MSTTQTSPATQYDIDPAHSHAQFKVRHMMIANVRGEFTKIAGKVTFDPAAPEASTIDVTIDASSINTREPQRDEHLKSADFFDVAKYPAITFRSKKRRRIPGAVFGAALQRRQPSIAKISGCTGTRRLKQAACWSAKKCTSPSRLSWFGKHKIDKCTARSNSC